VLVKYVDEVFKICWGVVPDSPDIIQVLVVRLWEFVAFVECVFFPFGHVNVGVSGGKSFSHGCSFDLEVPFVIKAKVIALQVDL